MTRTWFVLVGVGLLVACNRDPGGGGAVAPPPAKAIDIDEIVELNTPVKADADLQFPLENNPIPAGKDQPSAAQHREVLRRYFQREIDQYVASKQDAEPVRTAGREFLTAYVHYSIHDPQSFPLERIVELGERAVEQGSKHPTVLLYHAIVQLDHGNAEAERLLQEVAPQLERGDSSAFLRFLVHYRLFWKAQAEQRDFGVSLEKARQEMANWIREDGKDPANVRILWGYVDGFLGSLVSVRMEEAKQFFDTCRAIPEIDPWLLHMIAGKYYLNLAWHYRGTGTLSWVSPEGAEKHARFLPVAAQHYTRAWQFRPQFPEAPAEMIFVTVAGGDPYHSPRTWFDHAVRAEFDHDRAYDRYYDATLPRWGGSNDELLAFGRECAATQRFDTMVPDKLIALVMRIRVEVDGDPNVLDEPGLYEDLKEVIQGYENSGTYASWWLRRWRSCGAAFGVLCNDFAAARAAFEKLGDDLGSPIFSELRLKPTVLRGQAYALTGPAAEIVQELRRGVEASDRITAEQAVQRQQQLAEARRLDPSPQAADYFRELETLLGWQAAFAKGEWAELKFDPVLSGWNVINGEHRVENDSTIWMSTLRSGGGMRLYPQISFPEPFVVEADVEEVQADQLRAAGICVGNCERLGAEGKYFWIDGATSQAGMMRYDEVPRAVGIQLKQVNRMRVKVWPHSWELTVNGFLMHQEHDSAFVPEGLLSFGEMAFVGARGEMRLGRIRVRALDHGPFPANPDGESVAAYARAAVQFDPDDSHAQLLLAESLLASGKSAEAEAPLEKAKQLLDPQYHHSSGLTYLLGYFEEVHGRYEPAVEHLQLALQIPRLAPGAARRLAWIKATCPVDALRGVAEAQQYLEQCATGSDPDAADYLEIAAAVQAEGGDFSSAVATQRRALEKLTDAASRTSAQERLDLYLQNKPYRVPAVAAK